MISILSLFSGFGTQELGLNYSGLEYQTIGYSEINKRVIEVYETLHNSQLGNLGDVKKISNIPDLVNVLTYSFPCQDISVAGKGRGIKKGTRSGLLLEVERLIQSNHVEFLLMENVKHLVSKRHFPNFQNHIKFLNDLGYGCHYMVLNGADYGCPQNRERVFMISILNKTNDEVKTQMEQILLLKEQRVVIRDILEPVVDQSLYIQCDYQPKITSRNSLCKQIGTRTDVKYEHSQRIYSIDGCSPCLTKTVSPIILTDQGVRYLSPRESFRCMGVKEEDIQKILKLGNSNKFYQSICGDAICVPIIKKLFEIFF